MIYNIEKSNYQRDGFAEKKKVKNKKKIFLWKKFRKKQKSQKTFFSFLFWKIWKSKKKWIKINSIMTEQIDHEEWLTCFTTILFHDGFLDECYHFVIVPSEIKQRKIK